jgi:hypothetical protein
VSTPSKDKGDRAERDVVKYLQPYAPTLRRTKAGGEKDLGDILGFVDRSGSTWTLQVADRKWTGHAQIINKAAEAQCQAVNAGVDYGAMIAKRPGCKDVGDWFVWLPTWLLLDSVAACNAEGDRVDQVLTDLACITVRAWLELHGGLR